MDNVANSYSTTIQEEQPTANEEAPTTSSSSSSSSAAMAIPDADNVDSTNPETTSTTTTETTTALHFLQNASAHHAPRLYLVMVNISKFSNASAMVRGAIALGCYKVLWVGATKNWQKLLEREGNSVITQHCYYFDKWKDCIEYLQSNKVHLIGVEIDETSHLLDDEYFDKHLMNNPESYESMYHDIGLLLGNEGQGILPKFLYHCTSLVRIPQYGAGTASLNVNVATSIVLHRFSVWKQRLKTKQQQQQHDQETRKIDHEVH